MPRKATTASSADEGGDQVAPRRSTRIATQPRTEETKPAPKPRATKKRAAEDVSMADATDGAGEEKTKAKKAKADTAAEGEAGGSASDSAQGPELVPELASIDIGDTLPSLVLQNERGEDLQVAEIANEKGAVIFLVPKADTPGCTMQACGFRDIFPDFSPYGYDVYCLSADSPSAQTKWQTKKELPYSLISDPKRILISALGAGDGGKTKRSHFIFEKGGKLVDKKIPVKPAESPKLALEFIKGASSS